MYPIIDKEKTGLKLKSMLKVAGYNVKFVQEYLHLSCPQPIYRWFQGKILPSVENLCALSRLLGVHMEELLVLQGQKADDGVGGIVDDMRSKRLLIYARHIKKIA